MTRSIAGIEVEIIRKNIRSMNLSVRPDGTVRLSAPRLMPNAMIDMFVRSRLEWIHANQQKQAERNANGALEYETGETIYVWGRACTLRVAYRGRNSMIIEEDGTAVLTVRADSTRERREAFVKEWYRNELTDAVEQLLPKWERITNLHPSGWQSKDMSTRWGTCNTKTKKIWLNVRLAQHPPECLEYVILHELTHLRIRNHSTEFYAAVAQYMPDWKQRKKLLNK